VFGNRHLSFSYFPETTRWLRGYSIGEEGLKRERGNIGEELPFDNTF